MQLDIDRIIRETFIARAEYLPLVDSTNNRAAELAADGALPLLVAADQQTAGRGRGSNRWWTGSGALAFSLVLEGKDIGAENKPSPLVALAVGTAVAETMLPLLPDHKVGIHWPNDVYADGRKLAGILIEALANRRHIIGIGVNVNNTLADAPPELQCKAATLRDLTNRLHDPTEILIALLDRLEQEFVRLRQSPESVAAGANMLCLQCGSMLTLERSDRVVVGRCGGIAPDGALILETSEGTELVYSGTLLEQSQQ